MLISSSKHLLFGKKGFIGGREENINKLTPDCIQLTKKGEINEKIHTILK